MRRCPVTPGVIAAELTRDLWNQQEMRGYAWSESSRSRYHVSADGRRNLDSIVALSAEVSEFDKMPRHLSRVQLPQMVNGRRRAAEITATLVPKISLFRVKRGQVGALDFALIISPHPTERLMPLAAFRRLMCHRKWFSVAHCEGPHVTKLNKPHHTTALRTTDPTHACYDSHGHICGGDKGQ